MPLVPLQDEAVLLKEIAEGSQKAFSRLFYGYQQQLGAFVQMVTGLPEMAEEVVQDVFVQIWQKRSSLPEIEHFSSWLFIVTKNKTLNALRNQQLRQKKWQQYELDIKSGLHQDLGHDEDQEYYDLLQEAVEQLPPQQKRAFQLRYQENLPYAAIADSMNLSPDTVKKYLYWASKFISEFISSRVMIALFMTTIIRP